MLWEAMMKMADVRYIEGAKLLLTKAFAHGRKKVGMCDEFTTVADIPHLLQSSKQTGLMSTHAFKIISLVITFIERDGSSSSGVSEAGSEDYIVGDLTGCIHMHIATGMISIPKNLGGNTFIVLDIAVVVSGCKIHLEAIEDTRFIPCGSGHDSWVRRDNDISRNRICAIKHST